MSSMDPVAAVIAYLRDAAEVDALVDGRVAAKHKFALADDGGADDAWPTPAQALRVQAQGGPVDLYTSLQTPDLAVTCFGGSQAQAMAVALAVVDVCRRTGRTLIPMGEGEAALLYYLVTIVPPRFAYEALGETTGLDTVELTLRAGVSACPITV